jgi:hypothetical protein
MLHLGDVSYRFHVSSIATGTKDNSDLGIGIDVVGGDKGTSCVADDRSELDWYILKQTGCVRGPGNFSMTQSNDAKQLVATYEFGKRLGKHGGDVVALDVWRTETLRPSNKFYARRVVASTWSLAFQGRQHRISALDLPA